MKSFLAISLVFTLLTACSEPSLHKSAPLTPTISVDPKDAALRTPTLSTGTLQPRLSPSVTPTAISTPFKTPAAVAVEAKINWQSPNGQYNSSISFVSMEKGWVAAETSLIYTGDGGKSWRKAADLPTPFFRLDFVDDLHGWGMAEDGIYDTKDGGKSWGLQHSDSLRVGSWIWRPDFDFVTPEEGWFWSGNKVFQTHDGGSTWLPVSLPSLPSQWGTELTRSTISFITPRLGWLLQSICVMPICHFWLSKTNDGGETWEPVANSGSDQKGNFPSPMRPGDEIFFLDQQHGWFIDSVYSNYETKDGGKTWDYSEITLGGGPTINQLHMFTPLEGIAAYSGGVFNVVKTRDGGKHWDAIYPPLEPTTNMQFFNERQGFGTTSETGPKTLISTQDGGETWQKVRELPCDTYFIDMMAGWGICDFSKSEERKLGSKPELYHTKDGGKSWQPIETPSELVTISFQFIDDRTGFVWDHWSHLLGTADGGRTWKPIQLDQSKFPLAQEQGGWVLVENKGIYHASPGDSTWQMVLRLQSVLYFDPVSPQVAWVSGFDKVYGLTLQKTMDGGKTWLQFRLEGINDRSDAWFTFAFIDDMRGWLRTRQGLFRTTDGGLTWNQIIPLLLP